MVMVYSEKLLNMVAPKSYIYVLHYNCLYYDKGNNSSVKGSNLTELIGYQGSMVLLILTKIASYLTKRY